jgi:PAS domain S-box-containing protein
VGRERDVGKAAHAPVETARLRALVSSLGLGVLVENEMRRVALANEAFCRMFGIPAAPADLAGSDCAEAARRSAELVRDPEAFLARIEHVLAGRVAAAGDEIAFRDGRVLERDYFPIAVDSAERGHLWVYRDVTRMRHESRMRRAAAVQDELRLAVDTIPGLVWSALPDGYMDFLNQRWCEYTGLTLEQACGWGWEAAIFADDLPGLRAYWRSVVSAGQPGETEARLRRFDGVYRWFLFRAVPLHDERGEVAKWYGQTIDIDERKRAEALLAGENRLLEMVAQGCPLSDVLATLCRLVEDGNPDTCRCGIVLVDPDGTRLQHGAAPSLPASYNDAIHGQPVNSSSGPCAMAAYLKTPVIAADVESDTRWDAYEWRKLALAHGLRSCWSTPILSVEGKALGTFAIYQDEPGGPTPRHQHLIAQFTHLASVIIERKRAEEALQRAQAELSHVMRVTTLGELAASIAHEINQPLTAIVADASACLNWLAREQPDIGNVREALLAIRADGTRAGEVLTRIRALLARSTTAHEPCDLGAVINGALPLIRPELARHGVVLETALAAEAEVMGDAVELQQVLLNLLLNASEAARELEPERRRVVVRSWIEQRDDGPWALVSVEDAGVGIDPSELERVFAAFYTTKPGGLGMGLSIIRSIIDRHGGRLWAESNAAHGATFSFSLPTLPR